MCSYLYGTRFEVQSEHESLRWLLNVETPSGQLARWNIRLQELYYEVIYRPGKKYLAQNGLSRLCTDGNDDSKLEDDIVVMAMAKVDAKTLDTLNKDDPVSQKPTTYPTLKQVDDRISRETFVR